LPGGQEGAGACPAAVRTNKHHHANQKNISRSGYQQKKGKALAEKVVEDFGVKTTSIEKLVAQLSGGNQQKIVLGR
jgi:ABC-type sugar transport system ATPase subunit